MILSVFPFYKHINAANLLKLPKDINRLVTCDDFQETRCDGQQGQHSGASVAHRLEREVWAPTFIPRIESTNLKRFNVSNTGDGTSPFSF